MKVEIAQKNQSLWHIPYPNEAKDKDYLPMICGNVMEKPFFVGLEIDLSEEKQDNRYPLCKTCRKIVERERSHYYDMSLFDDVWKR